MVKQVQSFFSGTSYSYWLVLAAQAVAIVIFLVHLDDRSAKSEADIARIHEELARLDQGGTRRLAIIEDRQMQVLKHLDSIDSQTSALRDQMSSVREILNPHRQQQ